MRMRPPWPPWFADRTPQPDAYAGHSDHASADLDPDLDAIAAREVSAWLARADLLIGDD